MKDHLVTVCRRDAACPKMSRSSRKLKVGVRFCKQAVEAAADDLFRSESQT